MKPELRMHPNIVDNRERCLTCDMIVPQHRRWCIRPVIAGKRDQEAIEIEGEQSIVINEGLANAN